jgi:hypothetical protein
MEVDAQHVSIDCFLAGSIGARPLRHRDHVQIAFDMLQRDPFLDVARAYARALQKIAMQRGHPEHYHETMTFGFLSLIAERRMAEPLLDFVDFENRNKDIFDPGALLRWYGAERLGSQAARKMFILPDPRSP